MVIALAAAATAATHRAEARAALDSQDRSRLVAALAALARIYPFDAAGILPAEATPERLRMGEAIHEATCAGCHDHPDTRGSLPAHNLFRWARTLPAAEFAARACTRASAETPSRPG